MCILTVRLRAEGEARLELPSKQVRGVSNNKRKELRSNSFLLLLRPPPITDSLIYLYTRQSKHFFWSIIAIFLPLEDVIKVIGWHKPNKLIHTTAKDK